MGGQGRILYSHRHTAPSQRNHRIESQHFAKEGFDDAEQIRLRDFCARIAKRNSYFVASNSDAVEEKTGLSFFDRIYDQFNIKRVSATRMIDANATKRGFVSEIMISNIANVPQYEGL